MAADKKREVMEIKTKSKDKSILSIVILPVSLSVTSLS